MKIMPSQVHQQDMAYSGGLSGGLVKPEETCHQGEDMT